MVSPNIPLQRRTGQNIGVSPIGAGLAAYQQATNAPYITLDDTDTVLWEGQANCARVPGGSASQFPALLVTDAVASLDSVDLDIFFVDDQGNELEIGIGGIDLSDGSGLIQLLGDGPKGWGAPFCLEVGEKIIARVNTGSGGALPAGRVQCVAYSKDIKIKGQGKGGLSDGGVVCIEGDINAEGFFEFGPPPGQTWEGIYTDAVLNTSGDANAQPHIGSGHGLGLFIAVQDPVNTFDFFLDLVDVDGNVLPVSTGNGASVAEAGTVTLQNVSDAGSGVNPLFILMPPLQFPAKMRIRHDSASTLPTGRIQVRLMMAASDVASDLTQGS